MAKQTKTAQVEATNIDATLEALPSTSSRVRYLTAEGWDRKAIATKLGIRYQHVRNVQVTLLKKDIVK